MQQNFFCLSYEENTTFINTHVRQVYDFVSGLFTIGNRSAILVNSTFTKELVERFLCRNTIVVYPPVDVKAFGP